MKHFTRILLAAVAGSLLLAPMAQAQSRHDDRRYDDRRPGHHFSQPPKKSYSSKHVQPRHHYKQWKKGERVSDWKRRPAIRDYHRHGLKRPGHGQHWVKVDNSYLLVSLATGFIAGIAAAR